MLKTRKEITSRQKSLRKLEQGWGSVYNAFFPREKGTVVRMVEICQCAE
jgi:hypothetical protein